MTVSLEELQIKYLTFDENGENASFNDDFLDESNQDLHSELTELIESGYYFTNHQEIGDRLCAFLENQHLSYRVESSHSFCVQLYVKVS